MATTNIMMDGAFPLKSALAMLNMPPAMLKSMASVDWMSFGKMDSHIYRKQIMERMKKAALTGEEMFMIYFLFSIVKNQKRVLMGMDSLPDTMKTMTWYTKVRAFVDSNMCQYVSQVTKTKKFPAVNIPVTNPGMDLLCWAMWTPPSTLTITEMFRRPNASQLALNPMAQSQAKVGYAYYWNSVVKGTKNPDAKDLDLPKPGMKEDYYSNAERDKYPLVLPNLKAQIIPDAGYSTDDLKIWMMNVKLVLHLGRIAWLKNGAYVLMDYSTDPKTVDNFSTWIDTTDELLKRLSTRNVPIPPQPTTERGRSAAPGPSTGTGRSTPTHSTERASSKGRGKSVERK